MAQVINTNVLSLNAQRNLSSSQSQLATSLQRLSSGLRINSAKDDAAGLAISERFTTQIRGLNQAIRNANDGISLAQTSEAALNEVGNNLQRIRELAVQSANATNSEADRATLQKEVDLRLAEIERIASQTSFNGRNVLDGSFGNALFQVGANVGQTISLTLDSSVRTNAIGDVATAQSVDLEATGVIVQAQPNVSAASGAFAEVTLAGVTTGATNDFTFSVGGTDLFTIEGNSGTASTAGANVTITAVDFQNALEAATLPAGFTFSGSAVDGSLQFTKVDGADFTIAQTGDGGNGFSGAFVGNQQNGTEAVSLTLDASNTLNFTIGDGQVRAVEAGTYNTVRELVDAVNRALEGNGTALLSDDGLSFSLVAGSDIVVGGTEQSNIFSANTFTAQGSLEDTSVETVAGANEAIFRIDSALTAVADLRSELGAIQNRFESTIANLTTTSENLSAARSRIRDADFAQETAELTRLQILQQAGISVLAQANVAPQSVLALLQ